MHFSRAAKNAMYGLLMTSTILLEACSGPGDVAASTLDAGSGTGDGELSGPSEPTTGTSGCGDGRLDASEACDDGNQLDGDACTNMCTLAVCGDGIKSFIEGCDDGNLDDSDKCNNGCNLPWCGDGVVQGDEACDDANSSNKDGCLNHCEAARCGDAFTQEGVELCDYGDIEPGDTCSSSCMPTKIFSIGVGGDHVCVAFENGTLRCWGQGEYGALCSGDTDDRGGAPGEMPAADINTGGAFVVQVSSGGGHSCSRSSMETVQCWGAGEHGVLGDGAETSRGDTADEVPRPPVDLGALVSDIAAGGRHNCAVVTGNKVRCWGYGQSGQLGYGTSDSLKLPNKLDVPGIEGAVGLALGSEHSCVLQKGGEVRCWGLNSHGQLGLGHTLNVGDKEGDLVAPPAILVGGPVSGIAAGGRHTCALSMDDGTVRCWGSGEFGQLGNGGFGQSASVGDEADEMPPKPVNIGPAQQVVAGWAHTCALLMSGKVKCWGQGEFGALGYGDTKDVGLVGGVPPKDVDLGDLALRLGSASGFDGAPLEEGRSTEGRSTCGLLMDRSLRCWGGNIYGELGYGHTDKIGDDETPSDLVNAGPVPF